MLKLLDKYYVANLAFFNDRYRLIYKIPAIMTVFMAFNISSVVLIILPFDFLTFFLIGQSIGLLIITILYIRYNDRRSQNMIERLKALPEAVVIKYKITLIIYYLASVGVLFLSAYFMKNYEIDWSWLF